MSRVPGLYLHQGRYRTLKEIADMSGIDYSALTRRLKRHGSFHKPRRRRRGPLYTYDGRALTLPQWAEIVGIDASTIKGRLHRLNWPMKEALSTPPLPMRTYEYAGQTHSLEWWAKRFGIKLSTLQSRLYVWGWTFSDALNTPVGMKAA